jgi:4-hydroxy-tetrahydrodipicolinate synthase
MSSSHVFSGLWIPVVTPFREGDVDTKALSRLVQRLCRDGVDGLVVCGSTGEAASLSAVEQLRVLEVVLSACGNTPVAFGVSGAHLSSMLQRIGELAQWPLAGLLVSAPYYVRPPQSGVRDWFTAIADVSRHPVMLYDIPYRTGATIARETLLALAEHPNIRAYKDCAGDPGKTLALISQAQVQVLAGEDLQMLAVMAQGGSGAIAASAHLATPAFVRMMAALRRQDLEQARAHWLTLVPWVEAAFAQANPIAVKAQLALRGEMRDELRAPMGQPDPSSTARDRATLASIAS